MTAKSSASSKTPASTKKPASAAKTAASKTTQQKPAPQTPAPEKPVVHEPVQTPVPKKPVQKKPVAQKPPAPAANSAQLAAPATATKPKPKPKYKASTVAPKTAPKTVPIVDPVDVPAKAPRITKNPPGTPPPAYLVAAKPPGSTQAPSEPPASPSVTPEPHSRWHRLIPALVLVPVLAAAGTLLVLNNGGPNPVGDAQEWVTANSTPDQSIVVADDMTGQFTGSSTEAPSVLAYSELMAWRDADYVVTGPALAESAPATLAEAVANSTVVASFGEGAQRVDVRMVTPQGAVLAAAAQTQATADRAAYGAELAVNPALQISDEGRELLAAGRVDPRIVVILATLIVDGGITVGGFPVIDGEQAGPIRQVQITKVAGGRVAYGDEFAGATQDVFTNLTGPYAPADVIAEDDAVLLRYPLDLDPLSY